MSFGGNFISDIGNAAKSVAGAVTKPVQSLYQSANTNLKAIPGQATLLVAGADPVAAVGLGKTADKLYDSVSGISDQRRLSQASANQQALINQQAAATNNLENQANANYGVGLSPQATGNARLLAASNQQAQNDAQLGGQQNADNTYQQGLSQERINAARSGNLGSGADAQTQADLQTQLQGNTAAAIQGGQQTANQLQAQQNAQRNSLLQGIQGGQITNPAALATQLAGYQQQGSNNALLQGVLGGAITGGTAGYGNAAITNAGAGR